MFRMDDWSRVLKAAMTVHYPEDALYLVSIALADPSKFAFPECVSLDLKLVQESMALTSPRASRPNSLEEARNLLGQLQEAVRTNPQISKVADGETVTEDLVANVLATAG